jgi:hypothetical protein
MTTALLGPRKGGTTVNYLKFPLHLKNASTVVEVTLNGVESDVFLVDDSNLASFERGGQYAYFGGHYKASPVILTAPSGGSWTVVVIPLGGRVEASVRTVG